MLPWKPDVNLYMMMMLFLLSLIFKLVYKNLFAIIIHTNVYKIVYFIYRRKKKCIRFIIGADGETTEVPDKEQTEHSDSETENENHTEIDSKEKLQELVTMATTDYQKLTNNNSSINNNNNNNNNGASTAATTNKDLTVHSSAAAVNCSSSTFSISSSLNQHATYANPLNNNLQTIDTNCLKTISATCS